MKKLTQKEFKLPNAPNINGRKSTIAKALSDGIAPRIRPTQTEFNEFLNFFLKGVDETFLCAYCGNDFDYFEHFRPLVINRKPTGYGSDIYNLVPSCKNCNEKKKNDPWKKWMEDINNPGHQNSVVHDSRIKKLEDFETWGLDKVTKIDFEKLIGSKKWQLYLTEFEKLMQSMNKLNELQSEIRLKVKEKMKCY